MNLECFILATTSALFGSEPNENPVLEAKLDWAVERHLEVEQLLESDE